jgi:spermidine synthase
MNGKEKLVFGDNYIFLPELDGYVMHVAEKKLMRELALLATRNGGHILEIGFGLNITADFVQENPNVLSHTIIEVHPEIYERAVKWAENKKNVTLLLGSWEEVIPKLDKKFDGVLHDTHEDPNIPFFLTDVKKNCNENCIVAFFEYLIIDYRLGEVIYEFENESINNLPYSLPKKYPLKYTIFRNGEFSSDNY